MSKNKAAKIENKVCRNHPDRPAAVRCITCFTPVCEECVYEREGHYFCSRNCAANYDVVNRNLSRYEEKKQADRTLRIKRYVRFFVRLSLYGAITLFAWWFYATYTEAVHNWLNWFFNLI